MKIEYIEDTAMLTEIIAGLVKQGLTFRAYQKGAFWVIELTGGF